jgi:hypothetical protein
MRLPASPENEVIPTNANPVDAGYVSTTGLQLIAGSDFTDEQVDATTSEKWEENKFHYILNETAVKQLGFTTPEDAIGREMVLNSPGIIVGVIFVRSTQYLQDLVESNPFAEFNLPPAAKPVVTFLRTPADRTLSLPIEHDGASILKVTDSEVLAAYLPGPNGPVFMRLLERTFGTNITTRTLGTVRKCAWA